MLKIPAALNFLIGRRAVRRGFGHIGTINKIYVNEIASDTFGKVA